MINLAELEGPKSITKSTFLDQLLEGSNNFSTEVVLRDIIDQQLVRKLLELSNDALVELCKRRSFAYGFRIWKADEQKNTHFIKDNVFSNPPSKNDTIGEWIERVFGDEAICFIMNNAEGFSDEMAILMSKIFKPVLEHTGIPMNGLHSTSIFGNYGFTPLGIHHDTKGSFVLNLHLGPGVKKMYTWEWDHFLSLGGKMNEKNVHKFLPEAKEHIIHPGDVFFMPWDKFHVGYTDGYSLSMTAWFDFHTALRLMTDLVTYLTSSFIQLDHDFISGPVLESNHKEKFHEVMNKFVFEGNKDSIPLKQNLLDAHEMKMLRLFSNGGWKSVALTLEEDISYNRMEFGHFFDRSIRNVAPFRIYTKVQEESVYVFVRGHARKYRYDPQIIRMIEILNTFEVIDVKYLMREKPESWEDDSFLFFLSTLYNLRGIEIIDKE
jgi:hypothetical protein